MLNLWWRFWRSAHLGIRAGWADRNNFLLPACAMEPRKVVLWIVVEWICASGVPGLSIRLSCLRCRLCVISTKEFILTIFYCFWSVWKMAAHLPVWSWFVYQSRTIFLILFGIRWTGDVGQNLSDVDVRSRRAFAVWIKELKFVGVAASWNWFVLLAPVWLLGRLQLAWGVKILSSVMFSHISEFSHKCTEPRRFIYTFAGAVEVVVLILEVFIRTICYSRVRLRSSC